MSESPLSRFAAPIALVAIAITWRFGRATLASSRQVMEPVPATAQEPAVTPR